MALDHNQIFHTYSNQLLLVYQFTYQMHQEQNQKD